MNDMKRLLSYAGPYKRDMIFGAVLVLVETCFELFIPILISNLIDIGVANGDIPYIYRKRFGRRSMRRCSSMHFPTSTTLRYHP